jgi:hypothetical protein
LYVKTALVEMAADFPEMAERLEAAERSAETRSHSV